MRVWIEIRNIISHFKINVFHPLMRVWIEIVGELVKIHDSVVSPSYEGVD